MTRFLFLASTLAIFALNGAALWYALIQDPGPSRLEVAALVVNAVAWPLAMAITYRIGQATGRLKLHAPHKGRPHPAL
ncbi:MAG: hypothetical protein AB7J30_17390 [Hyphomicrobium sp.]|uniref:hypothetical protein n=1 Tax=Hyphomicrobium sp. TaxID=82 RepID=UPI003D125E3C